MTTLFQACAALLILGALIGWAADYLFAGLLLAVLAIFTIIVFLGDD
jgi:phosphatidylglycerophosphate synthase